MTKADLQAKASLAVEQAHFKVPPSFNPFISKYILNEWQGISSDKASNLPKRDVRFILLK